MKKALFISALLLICRLAFSQSGYERVSYYETGANTNVKFSKEKKVDFYFRSTDSDSNKSSKTAKKRKRPKGTEVGIYLVNENYSSININENNFIFSLQASYYLQLFSSNGKRGPPSVI